jgi:cell shape-determining protein MreC
MIYRPKNKKKNKFFKIILFIFSLLLILRLFNNSFAMHIFNYPVNYILDSTHTILSPIKNLFLYVKDKDDLQKEILQLKKENIELKLNQISYQTNTQEFEHFKSVFGVFENNVNTNLLRVISRPPFLSFDLLQITGDLEQYTIGDFVFYKNILIGKLVEKNKIYGTVKLFSSPQEKTLITVRGAQFEATGLGSGRYIFEVAKDFQVEHNDVISLSADTFFVLGVVNLVESKEEDLFKKVYFNVPVPLSIISYVTVGQFNKAYEQ